VSQLAELGFCGEEIPVGRACEVYMEYGNIDR